MDSNSIHVIYLNLGTQEAHEIIAQCKDEMQTSPDNRQGLSSLNKQQILYT